MEDFNFLDSKITADGDCSHKIKRHGPWEKSYDKLRQSIKKQRHYFADKGMYSQSYVFFQYSCMDVRAGPYRRLKVKVSQSCLTLCNSMDCSLPGSSLDGILQAKILEWVAMPFSRGSSQTRDRTQVSCIAGRFFTILATREAPPKNWCFWTVMLEKTV